MLAATTVTYQVEALSDALWHELSPLLEAHYHEVAHYDDIPLQPDREAYARIAATGGLRIFTARDGGRLVGYLAAFVNRSLHYRSVIYAHQDVLFVAPEHRGSRTGVHLIRFAEDHLRIEGISVFYQHVKARSDLNVGPMLTRLLGYELIDEIYGKRLDREG